jgi:Ca2+-transporting ATPase
MDKINKNGKIEFYKETVDEVIKFFNSDRNEGLDFNKVSQNKKKYGLNVIKSTKQLTFLDLILYQFKSYLVWLLIFITFVAFFSGFYFHKQEQIIDGIIISIIVLVNVFVGAYQDYKSEKTAQLLKSMLKNEAIVIRNNKKQKINAEELVPGDIILLEEGDKVPADCRIIACKELHVDESMLTGESKPVKKDSEVISKTSPLAERKNLVFMNSYVVRGEAKCIVIRTGLNTEVGKIAKSLDNTQLSSPFMKEIDSASKKITYVALVLIFVVLFILSFKEKDWFSIFMIGSALIIGSIPEGLPAIVTFTLALGSLRLAKNNILVKKKSLLETLGSVDVICTDKTGTLTENKMKVKRLFFDMKPLNSIKDVSKESLFYFSKCGLLANEVKETDKGLQGDPEDIALIDLFKAIGLSFNKFKEEYNTIDFEPFSSETKYASSTNKVDGINIKFKKGAPEIIIESCSYVFINGKVSKLSDEDKKKLYEVLKDFSNEALRNIAFSFKVLDKKNKYYKYGEIFLGFVGMYDSPKLGVKKTIETIYGAGIDVKMITGDNVHTASAIAKECGFRNIKAITWDEIKDLSNEELIKVVNEYNIFARMSPEFKLKIVSGLQQLGHRVAITGDGVNDVPALKKAEVGIAMGKRGTDIAKEAADLILLDDNFSTIVYGIKEGRTIFSNVRKVINYLLTANLAEVIVVFLGALYGLMPFTAIQLLWVNFVTDIAPAMALGADPPHKDIMTKKPTGKKEKLINKRITLLTVFIGLKKVLFLFGVFWIEYKITHNLILAQTMAFTWLVMSHFDRIAAIRFDEKMPLFINKYVNWSIVIPILLQIIIIYTPISKYFKVVFLGYFDWFILILSVITEILAAKLITYLIDINIKKDPSDY